MGGCLRMVVFLLPLMAIGAVRGMTVAEVESLSREEAARRLSCVVTGAVTGAFSWLENSCVLADAAEPNGPSIYVAGNLPGYPRARFLGEGELALGDLIEVSGHTCRLMLQPGIAADSIRRIGWIDLPEPPVRRLADLMTGHLNNRRARINGVVRHVRIDGDAQIPVTLITLGTSDGVLVTRLKGLHIEYSALRNTEVEIDGIVMPGYNQRAEFLRPELEMFDEDSLRVIGEAVRPIKNVGEDGGVLMWSPEAHDGHLRRMEGVVTYVSAAERFFVVQGGCAVKVFTDEDIYPDVGDRVEVVGFPTLVNDCGVMSSAEFRLLGRSEKALEPFDVPMRELDYLLDGGDPGELDCNFRFIRVEGRILSVERFVHGRTMLSLSVGVRNHRLCALLDGDLPKTIAKVAEDGPRVRLTGVLVVDLMRAPDTKRGLVVGGMTLLLRTASDFEVLPDAAFRARRMMRIVKTIALWLVIPLVFSVLGLILRIYRQRTVSSAVAAERRRMAGELHDTISQHLSGVRLLLFSVQEGADSLSVDSRQALVMAGNVLESARREVRDAVMNLQSESFVASSPETLLRQTAEGFGRLCKIRIRVNLRGLPSEMPSAEKTDLVAIVQESMTNAFKHGGASNVILVSDPLPNGGFVLSVLNDGRPFDVSMDMGPETGHFGLSGMRERANRSGFLLSFGRRDGYVEVRLERKNDEKDPRCHY